MAIAPETRWEFMQDATAGNVNGGGFNPANAGMLTDLACDTGTGNTSAPVVSSATYSFGASDASHWLYVKAGTDWTPGWYQIASVAAGKATLSAAIGDSMQYDSAYDELRASTAAGCATVGTPTGGTFSIDYSQATSHIITATDLTCTAGSTTIASASSTFTPVMVGNIIHPTALTGTGALVGWYEIATYVSATSVTLDRTPTNGVNNITAGTFRVGGAMSLNSTLDDEFFEMVVGGNSVYFKYSASAYAPGESVSVAAASGTYIAPIKVIGYNAVRSDEPTGSSMPAIAAAASTFSLGPYSFVRNFNLSTTATGGIAVGAGGTFFNCRSRNDTSSAATTRPAFSISTDGNIWNCDASSPNGVAITFGNTSKAYGCYIHDSYRGIYLASTRPTVVQNIIHACRLAGIDQASGSTSLLIANNTIHGFATPRTGTAGYFASVAVTNGSLLANNIISGWGSGTKGTTAQVEACQSYYNAFYDNTADRTLMTRGFGDTTGTDPQFVNAAEIEGTTATTSGSVLTDSGADFSSVTDGVDFLHVFSGTGVTVNGYLITSHTSTTLTVNNALGTSSAGNVVYTVTTGRNFAIGTNLKADGFPGTFPGGFSTGYMDPGAVQRQEAGTGGGGSFTFS